MSISIPRLELLIGSTKRLAQREQSAVYQRARRVCIDAP
jgi:hypothetical protein